MRRLINHLGILIALMVLLGLIFFVFNLNYPFSQNTNYASPSQPLTSEAYSPYKPNNIFLAPNQQPHETATTTPTVTYAPRPLPSNLTSAYFLWAENLKGGGYVVWQADVTNMASRSIVTQDQNQEIYLTQAVLSSDGKQLALVTTGWKQPTKIWVINSDGSNLTQLEAAQIHHPLTPVIWSPNSQLLAYSFDPFIEVMDSKTGQKRQFRAFNVPTILGWSEDGKTIFYSDFQHKTSPLEIWALKYEDSSQSKIATLGSEQQRPILSPDHDKLVIGVTDANDVDIAWLKIGDPTKHLLTQITPGFAMTWAPDSQSLIISQWKDDRSNIEVTNLSLDGSTSEILGNIAPNDWRFLAVSQDNQWLAAYRDRADLQLVFIASGLAIPIPLSQDNQPDQRIFIAWMPTNEVVK